VLIAILLPTLGRAREMSKRAKCASNIRQLVTAAIMRAGENPARPVLVPNPTGADDSLAYLIPQYLKSYDVAICPSTDNSIRQNAIYTNSAAVYGEAVLQDLVVPAANGRAPFGHSYEVFGWYSAGLWPDGTGIDGSDLGGVNAQLGFFPGQPGYQASNPQTSDVAKRLGRLHSPTTTILILDSDQDSSTDVNRMNNWPEAHNNHGPDGVNMGFADGHVEFIPRGPGLIKTYMAGYQGPAQDESFTLKQCPGLKITHGVKVGNRTFTQYSY
jgi:prepilin-type processing-associated H-X9-DG protein